ncbi:XcyI family restriction endonuclease (plasmid) [Mesorhizobium mediterraneum]|uniref:Restriction endonuclease n=4 Tax=Phyllobacteriaceae TaxID=69277 RepID=A0AB36R7M1_9HYPH|nr:MULTISPECIES: XcyI family restriction endonuclease [Mesorhizobium]PAQ00659.1 restriction endonuclease [Mesorhizobium mediterraneum]RUU85243.1 XcyI family restriction endonuclease [Mesorhizobium sp. M7A.F.Ca.MR.176.00.0.0]RWA97122.1 MAG: XcyI family restriction endonuclease [Mesorhizobium sp.]RWB08579.1 MAG: XcyI family restriction endonuclease [Mesorhizobium sp.]RWN24571.1 MAG: XcyI family restriction endonuclease [Mesorhizobium sp.]
MIPSPELQIEFSVALAEIRQLMLQEALKETVRKLDIPSLDRELAANVPGHSLTQLASHGIRGEMLFPVPLVLTANPRLIGYYRLLYGYSQKEFYTTATGAGRFISMETKGILRSALSPDIETLCKEMCEAGAQLLTGIAGKAVTIALLDDLTLLTLGPQLRGGANVRRGTAGIIQVFNVIKELVQDHIEASGPRFIRVRNAAGRQVRIEFAADPDIVIREEMRADSFRNIVAIEVKGGTDFSNIHNRIGEAEKSHQKARGAGYVECWTIVNVDRIDMTMAARESPTSNRFYRISSLVAASGAEFDEFRDLVTAMIGIAGTTS